MKHRNTLLVLSTLLLSILVGIACSEARSAAAKGVTPNAIHSEFGVLDSGVLPGPSSNAVTATFDVPFESAPVCTDAQRPGTVGSVLEDKGESAAATLSVVLMNVTTTEVTFFIHNPNTFADRTLINWHCVGQ